MNCIDAIRHYVLKIIKSTSGSKVLILDEETLGIISLVINKSEMLQYDVSLFEMLNTPKRNVVSYVKALCLIRPTYKNVDFLCKELQNPKYGEYHLYFTNRLPNELLDKLALNDKQQLIKGINEYFADYYAIEPSTWTLNLNLENYNIERIVDGITAQCLSFKAYPVLRYQNSSVKAFNICKEIKKRIDEDREFWFFGRKMLVLILDRMFDPVTPLLTSWMYKSMIHQHIGINNNCVDVNNEKIMLNGDEFYKENMNKNYGDFGITIKTYVDELHSQMDKHKNITSESKDLASLDDIKKFIEEYPEFKKLSGTVSKHVNIMTQLQKCNKNNVLFDCSELEQELACHHNKSEAVDRLSKILNDNIPKINALVLVMLFSMRYNVDGKGDIIKFMKILTDRYQVESNELASINVLISKIPTELDLFENRSYVKLFKNTLKKELVGVKNVYTQHKPQIENIVTLLHNDMLSEENFPYFDNKVNYIGTLVFINDGITYDEAFSIENFNMTNKEKKSYILGGPCIHNQKTFIDYLKNNS